MSSFREVKYTSKNYDDFDPILKDVTFAIRDPRVIELVSQITGIARLVCAWHGRDPDVLITPFLDLRDFASSARTRGERPQFDFVYVADGIEHKNHAALLDAWILLAQDGLRPSLALTLGVRHQRIAPRFASACREHGLSIENLGEMSRDAVVALYARSRALIHPSTSESFAIPLIEAAAVGLPVLAPELDYVHDVAQPVQTFDPASPVSIARAVRRFLGTAEPPLKIATPGEFLDLLTRI